MPPNQAKMPPKLAYLVTEDWYFLSHRLPMARAAQAAGFEVHVLTRIGEGRARIEADGFVAHGLDWVRKETGAGQLIQTVRQLRGFLQEIQPQVLHNIALKPALIGGLAVRGLRGLAVINNINGLGSAYLSGGAAGWLKRQALGRGLGLLLNRPRTLSVVQNPEDFTALAAFGVAQHRLRLIAGSGVDTDRLRPGPEPQGPVTVAYVGRLLADKGLRSLIAAHRLLRARGLAIELLLAGTPDPENPTSIPIAEIEGWAGEPGITWLGHVTDTASVWARSHIAVLPSRREGLPLSLLEASACGRPMIATDVPGCREIVVHGETGLLVPLDEPAFLADAIEQLAGDVALRQRFGTAARMRAETVFSTKIVQAQIAALYLELLRG